MLEQTERVGSAALPHPWDLPIDRGLDCSVGSLGLRWRKGDQQSKWDSVTFGMRMMQLQLLRRADSSEKQIISRACILALRGWSRRIRVQGHH